MAKFLKVTRGVGASGVSLAQGKIYRVPGDVSERDAAIICRLGKGEMVDAPEKPAKKSKGDEQNQSETVDGD